MTTVMIVCGGRDFVPDERHEETLETLAAHFEPDLVLHGGARGADEWAADILEEAGYRVEDHPADWNHYGKQAGPIRNRHMANRALLLTKSADRVVTVAFPGGKGTDDMIRVTNHYKFRLIDLSPLEK